MPSLKNRVFQGCLTVTFGAIFTNILSTIMIYRLDRVPLWMTWAVTTVYFILTPLMGQVYFLYTVSVIYTEGGQLRRAIEFGAVPGAAYLLLAVANLFTKSLFDISREDGYSRGPLVFWTYVVFYAYCLASIVVTVVNRRKIDREIFRILAAFPILAVAVIIVQELYPDVILSGSAATCALLIIYLHLQNKQISLDYLTGVPNRQELLGMLGLMLKRAPQREFVLLVLSLRDFRQVNNACGQQHGDGFLKQVSHFLCQIAPRGAVYRFGGDEFVVLFSRVERGSVERCVEALRGRLAQPWQEGDYRLMLSGAIGIIRHADESETLEKIVSAAEYAVSQAKGGVYGPICYCDRAMLEKLERKRRVIQALKEQIAGETFEMYYQPIYSVAEASFGYAESLMRIPVSPLGPIYPSEFIPIAEETGLIVDITYIVLDKVCRFVNRLMEKGIQLEAIHVNFSAVQFSQADLAQRVLEIIRRNGTPMSAIKIEFTESALAESTQIVTQFALEMERHGIKMGLDDFGTGYSNIATVINIPFETIKLDKSLIDVAGGNGTSALAVRSLTGAFKDLGMKVVAEGVETEEQRRLVVDFGVDQIQGYFYAKPMPGDEMERFLLEKAGGPADA